MSKKSMRAQLQGEEDNGESPIVIDISRISEIIIHDDGTPLLLLTAGDDPLTIMGKARKGVWFNSTNNPSWLEGVNPADKKKCKNYPDFTIGFE